MVCVKLLYMSTESVLEFLSVSEYRYRCVSKYKKSFVDPNPNKNCLYPQHYKRLCNKISTIPVPSKMFQSKKFIICTGTDICT
jgi:hypothetical protein